MKKLSLTKHVQDRRKTGKIPPDRLRFVMNHLIEQHNLTEVKDGTYKFRKGGTQAVIVKKSNNFKFITFFGPTGYVIDTDDIGIFNCKYQSAEYLKSKEERKARRRNKALKKEVNIGEPLKNLSRENKAKMKRGTFTIIQLNKIQQNILHSKFGHRPFHLLKSKFDSYSFIELLKYDGGHIKTLHKSFLAEIELNSI